MNASVAPHVDHMDGLLGSLISWVQVRSTVEEARSSIMEGGGGFYLYDFFLRVPLEGHVILYIASGKWHHGSVAPTNGAVTRYGIALANHKATLSRAATQMASTVGEPPGGGPQKIGL